MKKILIILGLILFTGCSSKSIDLKNVETQIIDSSILTEPQVTDIDSFAKRYSLDIANISASLVITSKKFDSAEMVLVILPKSGKTNEVKEELDKFINSYNNQWVDMNYFPKQKELVENALNTTYHNYLIYIVSNDNDKLLNLIKK